MYNNKLICITGPDGSGKSTLISNLLIHFPEAKKIGIWDAFSSKKNVLFQSKQDIDNYLCELSPIGRTLFLAHALQEATQKISENQNEIFFIDSYFYKYFSSELALNTPIKIIKSLVKFFPEPNLIIYLDLNPEQSALRKNNFSRYECGLTLNPCNESFVAFQNKSYEKWKFFKTQDWINIDANQSAEAILNQVINKIENQ